MEECRDTQSMVEEASLFLERNIIEDVIIFDEVGECEMALDLLLAIIINQERKISEKLYNIIERLFIIYEAEQSPHDFPTYTPENMRKLKMLIDLKL